VPAHFPDSHRLDLAPATEAVAPIGCRDINGPVPPSLAMSAP